MSNVDYPPSDIRIVSLVSVLKEIGVDLRDSRIQKEVQQIVFCILHSSNSSSHPSENWLTIVERAEQLGWKFDSNQHKEMLGRFINSKSHGSDDVGLRWKKLGTEDRYPNSYSYLWLVTPELDRTINKFFTTNKNE